MDIPRYNFIRKQGTEWSFSFRYKDANGNPVDLTGYTATPRILDKATGLSLTTPSVATLGASGIVALTVTATNSALIPAVSVFYDVILEKTGVVSKFLLIQGDIEVVP